ncbi:BMP family ABC transporter substrate-binding protein [Anaerotignum sp. MB30-C6]|uniref:BMP family ABC transporter substrate-binding protein n=1 Tax=Anaerotignum sp. MB30-C6 TaxID=3070814 RepID=UPI0027DBDDBE|nr:BMP family ABC transporter substrate-binding protein [Anaerotignum sp. MB30-C6]WMI79843.1 BMP family ABC transporter substrate-binding protein [Anaerotignum sp. MB30-C6]
MKKLLSMLLASALAVSMLAGCGGGNDANKETDNGAATEGETKVYKVCNLVNGNLGDKSFFDSAEAGLAQLKADGRIEYTTIEMGGTTEDESKWQGYVEEVSASGEYDLIVCGTYQMPDYLKNVAEQYPDQKYLIYDDTTHILPNVANLSYAQNDLGYLVGVYAGAMTTETSLEGINEDAVVGFVGGVDSPVINDFLYGFILGAQESNPDIKVDTRYVNSYVDPAKAKELAESMINDKNCDIIWGVAGNSGNGAAEAALETGKAYFIGVDSDQELTFSPEMAEITLTSGLKNVGNSLIWFFDEWDAGREHFGKQTLLGMKEGGIGIVTDKNFDSKTPEAVKEKVTAAIEAVSNGDVVVPTAVGNETNEVQDLREAVKP